MKNIKENMNNLYELNCLIGLRNGEKIAELAKKLESWIEKKKGELVEVERLETAEKKSCKGQMWVEKKRLAYPIKKDKAAYYLNSWIKLNPFEIKELKRFLKLEKEIVRFAILAEENIANTQPNREAVTIDEVGQLALQQAPGKHSSRSEFAKPKHVEAEKENKPEQIKPEPIELKSVVKEKPVEINEESESDKVVEIESEVKVKEKVLESQVQEEEIEEAKEEAKVVQSEEKNERVKTEEMEVEKEDKSEEAKKEKAGKHKKITLEELDKRLDDILNEDIL